MNKYRSGSKAGMWLIASLVAGAMAGCGSGGDDGKIFGSGASVGAAGNPGPAGAGPALGGLANFAGLSGGAAGMTNTGVSTVINGGDMGTTATATTNVTGFHDSAGDIYTETPANIGDVTGLIFTCTTSTTGPTSAVVNAASCATATQGAADALAAWNELSPASRPGATDPGANLSGLTLAPGIYATASGAFLLDAADLTLDAGGNADAVWVFQTASSLTVGGVAPTSIILAGGAQAKNVFWHVGSAATINAAGGGTMVGTIISSAGTTFSTVGNVAITTLDGRAASLNASVTMVNTVINVPAP